MGDSTKTERGGFGQTTHNPDNEIREWMHGHFLHAFHGSFARFPAAHLKMSVHVLKNIFIDINSSV